jgi:hypothetical protein
MLVIDPSPVLAADPTVPNRRRGPRRAETTEVAADRRQSDRRNVPGLGALLRVVLRSNRDV